MIRDVKNAFIRNLPNLDWMDSTTRRAAVRKVSVGLSFTVLINIASFITISTTVFSRKQVAKCV